MCATRPGPRRDDRGVRGRMLPRWRSAEGTLDHQLMARLVSDVPSLDLVPAHHTSSTRHTAPYESSQHPKEARRYSAATTLDQRPEVLYRRCGAGQAAQVRYARACRQPAAATAARAWGLAGAVALVGRAAQASEGEPMGPPPPAAAAVAARACRCSRNR